MKKIKIIVEAVSVPQTYGSGVRMSHMDYDRRKEYVESDRPTPDEHSEFENVIEMPRTRVPSHEDYNKVYGLLMGRGNLATSMSLEEMMKEVEAQEPASSAQALADYLIDRARIK